MDFSIVLRNQYIAKLSYVVQLGFPFMFKLLCFNDIASFYYVLIHEKHLKKKEQNPF